MPNYYTGGKVCTEIPGVAEDDDISNDLLWEQVYSSYDYSSSNIVLSLSLPVLSYQAIPNSDVGITGGGDWYDYLF